MTFARVIRWAGRKIRPSRRPRAAEAQFTGNYASWEAALNQAGGYSAGNILAKTREAMLKVVRGEVAFERDSVVFDRPHYNFPLLTALLYVASRRENHLSVLDFGGALGSTYHQCRPLLSGLRQLRWNVVEQPAHVACGQADFATEELRFHLTIDDCLRKESPDVLLLSSVLQYLPEPKHFLRDALARGFAHVIVDRTGFLRAGEDRLTVQRVPAAIYDASYPAWFFAESGFRRAFADTHEPVCEWAGADEVVLEGGESLFKGFLFAAKPTKATSG